MIEQPELKKSPDLNRRNALSNWLSKLLCSESFGGILLIVSTILAMILANSSMAQSYFSLLEVPLSMSVGDSGLSKPILLWVNDGLMVFFFLLIGLELKREIMVGELSNVKEVALPVAGAIGGIAIPALVYVALNWGDAIALQGWAIPAATDIAFAVGIIALLGSRVPSSLKLFLITLAIIDDLAAILIIAVFYTSDLSFTAISFAMLALGALLLLNRLNVERMSLYVVAGILLWFFVLKSGVHATLAGVALAFCIPYELPSGKKLLEDVEHGLHPWVYYLVIPIFAIANAGIPLGGLSFSSLLEPIPLGILLGLFIGKQLGVFSLSWLIIKSGIASLPKGVSWGQLYGACILTGVGFTMSLFISSLAFEHTGENHIMTERLGILVGSLLAALVGAAVLYITGRRANTID